MGKRDSAAVWRTHVVVAGLIFVCAMLAGVTLNGPIARASPTQATGLIVPLYSYPGPDWTELTQAKLVNPQVPVIAIVDPTNTGPGWYQDPNFVAGVSELQAAGIVVLGYVWTNYALRPLNSTEADMLTYKNWYGVNGIYLDQMASHPGDEWYYSTLTGYASSLGMSVTVGNPGADVPNSYIGTVNTMIIYENSGEPGLASLAGWHTSYSKSNFGIIVYGLSSLDQSFVDAASSYVGYIYVTDGVLPNPYSPASSYLSGLVTTLGAIDSGSAPPSDVSSGTITVDTLDQRGDQLTGLYTTLWQGGVKLQSCFSPCTFYVQGGLSYQVAVANYQGLHFDEWADGTTSRFYPVSEPGSATTLTLSAIYN